MKYAVENTALKYLLEDLPRNLLAETWESFEYECSQSNILSDRETKRQLEKDLTSVDSLEWLEKNKSMFKAMSEKESKILGELMEKRRFDFYEDSSDFIERRLPEGTPFVIAMAKARDIGLVYRKSKDSSRIIDICKTERITYYEVEEFLAQLKNNISCQDIFHESDAK